jgi:hypothetical protein
MAFYIHKQYPTADGGIGASDTWNINHKLGKKYVNVDAIISHDGKLQTVIPQSVTLIDDNNCVIKFSSPQVGEAKVNA